jgi:hypothetical protein
MLDFAAPVPTFTAKTARSGPMADLTCEVCGNSYDKAFQVMMQGKTHTFDSFECAIEAVAPRCTHCKCRVIGHGVEQNGIIFCCVHCASAAGVRGLQDRT